MEFEAKELAHYGLVKAVMDRLKLTERMGHIVPEGYKTRPKSEACKV